MNLLEIFQEDFDVFDEWGSLMEWRFTICHIIYHQFGPEHVPEKWRYKPSPLENGIDLDEYELIETYNLLDYSINELVDFGNYLFDCATVLKEKGEDY